MNHSTSETVVSHEQIFELVEAIWSSMLGLAITTNGGENFVRDAAGLTASVQISGKWNGVILLIPTERFARRATAIMLDKPEASLEMVDILDAVGELCNMIGGGIKSLLPGPSTLSLPTILQGSQYAVRIPKTRMISQLSFACESQPLEIRVLEGMVIPINNH
jgi:chemotaxis protein CheX